MLNKKTKFILISTVILTLSACGGDSKKNTASPNPIETSSTSSVSVVPNYPSIERPNPQYTPTGNIKTDSDKGNTNNSIDKTTSMGNAFKFETVKLGDRVGEYIVSDIKNQGEFTSVRFKGKSKISGSYNSDNSRMFGNFITLNPDEKSREKLPYVEGLNGINQYEFALDPQFQKDMDFTKLFGKTGSVGKFEIEMDEFLVTNWVESFRRVGKVSKVINITNNKH
jgi:hypothetical protein